MCVPAIVICTLKRAPLLRLPRLTPSGGGSLVRVPAIVICIDLHSIEGFAVALSAIDAFGRRLSCACPCHCDLQSIGGSAVALAAIDASGGGSLLCVPAIVICSL